VVKVSRVSRGYTHHHLFKVSKSHCAISGADKGSRADQRCRRRRQRIVLVSKIVVSKVSTSSIIIIIITVQSPAPTSDVEPRRDVVVAAGVSFQV